MPSSCQDIRAALAACLSQSPCVMAGNKPSDCLRMPLSEELPTQCQQLKKGYGDCKRGLIDMRKRFRGNKPVGMLDSAPDQDSGQNQMYGTIGIKKKEPVVEPVEGETER
ncbi:hypothetical protein BLS_000452 [Venturia inaequalis]|uniref:Cytochrome c oxidase assembly protein n=1 Tax=Venturia inaequalis TaxID=5025 RepID=A0A8H3YS24_VENIN|nr:hypothetical protein BLS_000452 [Venturia inaequalis]KAE9968037.1 hypothetical protein EG328_007813 [Venturia inaequalis]KAE9990907.1 hypothetical protein EG327_000788 [Venturia inaequalis]RDI86835.1 hypothetical protein Vi05172_g3140 [Venturia inaequalis]